MKNLVLAFVFGFIALNASAQNVKDTIQVHTDKADYVYKWKIISDNKSNPNKGCYGCASFYYKVERTTTADKDGNYYFFLYLMSNSFYKSGVVTGTYIRDLKVDLVNGGNKFPAIDPFWVLVPPKSDSFSGVHLAGKFKSTDSRQILSVTWGEYSVF